MTLEQLSAWSGKISLKEYEALLKKAETTRRALARACEAVYTEEASLEVLFDEKGSPRWEKHEKMRLAALSRANKLREDLKAIERKLAAG